MGGGTGVLPSNPIYRVGKETLRVSETLRVWFIAPELLKRHNLCNTR